MTARSRLEILDLAPGVRRGARFVDVDDLHQLIVQLTTSGQQRRLNLDDPRATAAAETYREVVTHLQRLLAPADPHVLVLGPGRGGVPDETLTDEERDQVQHWWDLEQDRPSLDVLVERIATAHVATAMHDVAAGVAPMVCTCQSAEPEHEGWCPAQWIQLELARRGCEDA